jgi:hypothetical protein
MSGEAGVKVFCRFRPFNKREIELGADKAVDFKFTPNSCKLEEGTRAFVHPVFPFPLPGEKISCACQPFCQF